MPFWKKKESIPDPIAVIDFLKTDDGGTSIVLVGDPEGVEADSNDAASTIKGSTKGNHSQLGPATNSSQSQTGLSQGTPAVAPGQDEKHAHMNGGEASVNQEQHAALADPALEDVELYAIEIERHRMSRDVAKMHWKNEHGGKELFCTFRGQTVEFARSGASLHRRDIVFHKSMFGERRVFNVDGTHAYILKDSKGYKDKFFLYPLRSSKKVSRPLAVFEHYPNSLTHRGQLRLYEAEHELDIMLILEDGVPKTTRLMDIAIISYFITLSFNFNESMVQAFQDSNAFAKAGKKGVTQSAY